MSFLIHNLSEGPVTLWQGSDLMCTVPAGVSLPSSLVGYYDVLSGGSQNVTTNTSIGPLPSTNGLCYVSYTSAGYYSLKVTGFANMDGQFVHVGQPIGLWYLGSFVSQYGTIPNASAVTYNVDNAGAVHVTYSATGTVTNYVTNTTPGALIGRINASAGLRSVECYPGNILTQDYAAHIDAFAMGFACAFALRFLRFVYSFFLSVISESD